MIFNNVFSLKKIRRLWFVRLPKPSSSPATKAFDLEIEAYNVQIVLINESINVKKIEREALQQKRRSTAKLAQQSKKASDAKLQEIKALKGNIRSLNAIIRSVTEKLSKLEVSSEAELDEQLMKLNHVMEHESISLFEEKKIIASIARLEVQRPQVIELERKLQEAMESKQEKTAAQQSHLSVLENEYVQYCKEHASREGQLAIIRKDEAIVGAEIEVLLTEYQRIKAIRDDLRDKRTAANKSTKKWTDAYEKNRKLSRSVRQALSSGRMVDAVNMCSSQTEALLQRLSEDAKYRAEYLFHWSEQRLQSARTTRSELSTQTITSSLNGDLEANESVCISLGNEGHDSNVKTSETLAGGEPEPKSKNGPLPARLIPKSESSPSITSPSATTSIADSDSACTMVDSAQDFEIPHFIRSKQNRNGHPLVPQSKEDVKERNRRAQEEALARKAKRDENKVNKVNRRMRALQSTKSTLSSGKKALRSTDNGDAAINSTIDARFEKSADADFNSDKIGKYDNYSRKTMSKFSKIPLQVAKAMEPVAIAKRPVPARRTIHEQLRLWYKRHQVPAITVAGLACSIFLIFLLLVTWYSNERIATHNPLQ